MPKKYIVRLTDAEREMLNGLIKQRRAAAQKVLRARVLLKADADGPHWTDAEIANAFDCRTQTIENIRERFVTEGFEITLHGKPKRRVRGQVLDGIQEAKIIALRLGPPPSGFANWTLRLLAAQAVALELVVICQIGGFLAKVRETGWFGGFAIFSRTRAGRRGRAIIEEKPPNAPRPGCHPYGITNFGQEPTFGSMARFWEMTGRMME